VIMGRIVSIVALVGLCVCRPVMAAGSIAASCAPLGSIGDWLITWTWTGDASTGSVPAGPANCITTNGETDLQGYILLSAEFAPGSPAPTSNYSATITDANGLDELGGQSAANLSATLPQFFNALNNPALNGVLTLNITGNSVASAQGTVYGVVVPPQMARARRLPFAGATGHLVSFGTGNVPSDSGLAYSGLPTLSGNPNSFTGSQNVTLAPGAATFADAFQAFNTTPATSGNNQWSPCWHSKGYGYISSSSQSIEFRICSEPGTSAAASILNIDSNVNGAGWNNEAYLTANGVWNTTGSMTSPAAFVVGLGGVFECTHGSNGTCGVSTLASGTVTVSTTAVHTLAAAGGAGYTIQLTPISCTSCGALSVGTVTNGTSFVINSTNASDASKVYWEIKYVN
jgi:hypothetical protein